MLRLATVLPACARLSVQTIFACLLNQGGSSFIKDSYHGSELSCSLYKNEAVFLSFDLCTLVSEPVKKVEAVKGDCTAFTSG